MTHASYTPDIRDARIDELEEIAIQVEADLLSPDEMYDYLVARLDALYPPALLLDGGQGMWG